MGNRHHTDQSSTNRITRHPITILLTLIVAWSCRDPYVSPYKSPATGYLVVEGYISGNSVTTFSLTRTIPLPGDSTLPAVDGATVQVQGSDNSIVNLTGQGGGIYSSVDTINLNPQLTYRLYIKTPNGEQYQSAYVPFKVTPPIDSVNWIQNGDRSIQLYVNTHSATGGVGYYQWNYDQAYEYHSAETSDDFYDADTAPPIILPRSPAQEIYSCWITGSSNSIIIGNTLKLSSNVIYEQPVKLIPPDDISTSVLYSILVREYALTPDGYNFLNLMQQNTESLGSIFDAQPSQITGNIQCLTVPTEQVIGYVSAGTVQSTRIYINREQIISLYNFKCPVEDTLFSPYDSLILAHNFGGPGAPYIPLYYDVKPNGAMGWLSNLAGCVNCTLLGGTTTKPSYWPTNQ